VSDHGEVSERGGSGGGREGYGWSPCTFDSTLRRLVFSSGH